MGMAKLNIWVTGVGEPCKIDNHHQWFVHILHCNGEILRWCDREFFNLKTECAHLEVEIPPGCYIVTATWSPAPPGQGVPTTLGNHITHVAVVRADCGEHACVTLFPPTFHWCGIWWLVALQENVERELIPREEADAAFQAVAKVLRHGNVDGLTRRMFGIKGEAPEGLQGLL